MCGDPGRFMCVVAGLAPIANCPKLGVRGPCGTAWPFMAGGPPLMYVETYCSSAAYGPTPGLLWQNPNRGFIWPMTSTICRDGKRVRFHGQPPARRKSASYLEKLVHSLCDSLAVDGRVGEVYQDFWRLRLRRLELLGFALLGHLGRLLAVLSVGLVPFLEPHVRGLGGVNDLLARYVFFVPGGEELQEFELQLRVEMRPQSSRGDELCIVSCCARAAMGFQRLRDLHGIPSQTSKQS